MVAAGTFGYGLEFKELIDFRQVGAIVTKSLTLEPRVGHDSPRIIETAAGMINAVGLANIGVRGFIKEKLPQLIDLKTRIVVSVAGHSLDEYVKVIQALNECEGISAYEINISCPNVKEGGLEFCQSPRLAAEITKSVTQIAVRPCFIKLSPQVSDIAAIAKVIEEAGAGAISLINTFVGLAIDTKKREPLLKPITGGYSGPGIKPIALAMVWKVAQAVKIPVIGMGGISSAEDAVEFLIAGATAVQIGTINFFNPSAAQEIVSDLNLYCRKYQIEKITQIIKSLKV